MTIQAGCSGQKKGITFTKGQVSEVVAGASGPEVKFKDQILDEDVSNSVDLVVLASPPGVRPGQFAEAVAKGKLEERRREAILGRISGVV